MRNALRWIVRQNPAIVCSSAACGRFRSRCARCERRSRPVEPPLRKDSPTTPQRGEPLSAKSLPPSFPGSIANRGSWVPGSTGLGARKSRAGVGHDGAAKQDRSEPRPRYGMDRRGHIAWGFRGGFGRWSRCVVHVSVGRARSTGDHRRGWEARHFTVSMFLDDDIVFRSHAALAPVSMSLGPHTGRPVRATSLRAARPCGFPKFTGA